MILLANVAPQQCVCRECEVGRSAKQFLHLYGRVTPLAPDLSYVCD